MYVVFYPLDSGVYFNRIATKEELNQYIREIPPDDLKYNRLLIFKIEGKLTQIEPIIRIEIA